MKKTVFCVFILIFTVYLTAVPDESLFHNANLLSPGFISPFDNKETDRSNLVRLPVREQSRRKDSLLSWRLKQTIQTNLIANNPSFKADFYYNSIYTNRLDSMLVMINSILNPVWKPFQSIHFTYEQSSQNLINYSCFDISSGIPFLLLDLDYVYNQDGICTDGYESLYYDDIQALIPVKRLHVFYNNEGIDCLYWWTYNHDYDLTYYSRIRYEYDSSGRPSIINNEVSSDSLTWQNSSRTTVLYHPSDSSTGADFVDTIAHPENPFPASFQPLRSCDWGLADQAQIDHWNGSEWLPNTKIIYGYNENDKLLIEIVMYYADGWQNLYHYMQTLNSNSLPIFMTVRDWYDYFHNWLDPMEQDEFFWEQFTCNEDNVIPSPRLIVFASPNPFRNEISVSYTVPKAGPVSVAVYNLKGQKVQTLSLDNKVPGTYSVNWNGMNANGNSAASGMYIIKVNQNGIQACCKVLRIK
ncbi:MAG TPA: FlgD immunoglobulin-like domain containing protein [Candidatus Cloacimonadota bacterium]|nr:FlgD immunoglobulin-like domain containing protein [Candidatus Cloacimonadota bacterium]